MAGSIAPELLSPRALGAPKFVDPLGDTNLKLNRKLGLTPDDKLPEQNASSVASSTRAKASPETAGASQKAITEAERRAGKRPVNKSRVATVLEDSTETLG